MSDQPIIVRYATTEGNRIVYPASFGPAPRPIPAHANTSTRHPYYRPTVTSSTSRVTAAEKAEIDALIAAAYAGR